MIIIWTLSQTARALEVSKERARIWWTEGRLPHDIEDRDGRPYWSRPPRKPTALRPGRKQRE
jgi:hypothetical protein